MRVAQIGLGRWGLLRTWAWHDVGANLTVFDPSPPPPTRLPPNAVLASTVDDAIRGADIVCVSTPPGIVAQVAPKVPTDVLMVVEKPGATTITEIDTLLNRKNLVMGFATIYDSCVARVADELRGKAVHFSAARLHQANLHQNVTVVEDLTVHDLVICDRMGLLDDYYVEVMGTLPHEVIVKLYSGNSKATIQSCVKSPNRVRSLHFDSGALSWDVNPDQYAICSDGRSIPPCQARPLFVECSLLLKRAHDASVKTEGDHERIRRVWEAMRNIREASK